MNEKYEKLSILEKDEKVIEKIKQLRTQTGMSKSQILRFLLRYYLDDLARMFEVEKEEKSSETGGHGGANQ